MAHIPLVKGFVLERHDHVIHSLGTMRLAKPRITPVTQNRVARSLMALGRRRDLTRVSPLACLRPLWAMARLLASLGTETL